jgi:mono/diheme cytochrome c family protein
MTCRSWDGDGEYFQGAGEISRPPVYPRGQARQHRLNHVPFCTATGHRLCDDVMHTEEVSLEKTLMRVLVVAGVLSAAGVANAQTPAEIEAGQKVYVAQKCNVCHSVAGQGNKKGPLDGISAKLSADDIRQWITNAPEMAAKAKAGRTPAMKALPNLPKEELDALVAYVQSLKK